MDVISLVESIKVQISEHEVKLASLKAELASLESSDDPKPTNTVPWPCPLAAEEYTRYGRQMILPGFGLPGQLRLRAAKVLIVGLGGLGCPAAAYLAGAGIGTLGLIDGDEVETSNLHRQILHSSEKVGMKKVDSASVALRSINPLLKYITYSNHLDSATALKIFQSYDFILDCTDAPQTRYLISDAAVIRGKPLISASALRTDGQLTILNQPPTPPLEQRSAKDKSGPCYRCIFPRPPPPDSVTSCGEGGILGPVVGIMGVMMALEAIKLLLSGSVSLDGSQEIVSLPSTDSVEEIKHSMTMLSASGSGPAVFRSIRLRGKRSDCIACGVNASIIAKDLTSGSVDYLTFCGIADPVSVLSKEERIDARAFSKIFKPSNDTLNDFKLEGSSRTSQQNGHITKDESSQVIIDVRDEAQFSICSLPESLNIPWTNLRSFKTTDADLDPLLELKSRLRKNQFSNIYTICRLGNDSQLAVKKLKELGIYQYPVQVRDVVGGFKSWKRDVDKDWPDY